MENEVENNQQQPTAPMPRYQCHKIVGALKILEIRPREKPLGNGTDLVVEPPFAPIWVDSMYMAKHKPAAGGYYVEYEDGYKSFSPAEAFESGYTRID